MTYASAADLDHERIGLRAHQFQRCTLGLRPDAPCDSAFTDRVSATGSGMHQAASPSTGPCRGEILTFPDTLTTQGLSLWSLNIVGAIF